MSLSIEITGKIHHIAETVFVTDKFSKREFVVHIEDEKNPKYDDYVQLQMTMDNCDKLNSVSVGDKVKIQTNLRGREYERKDGSGKAYFNSLDAWKIEVVTAATSGFQATAAAFPPAATTAPTPPAEGDNSLPF